MKRKRRIVHRVTGAASKTMCGRRRYNLWVTHSSNQVTCKSCKASLRKKYMKGKGASRRRGR